MGIVFAAFDVGTVSTCLLCATVENGVVKPLLRRAEVTDLGEGVDASGLLLPAAVERTLACVEGYLDEARRLARREGLELACTLTATSAARDARNAGDLARPLESLGLCAQVVPGDVEAALGLLGVTSDFGETPVLVGDIGGGSTELSVGRRDAAGTLVRGDGVSLDMGARRVTERFLDCPDDQAPDASAIAAARDFARRKAHGFLDGLDGLPPTLALVGGTATTLVAIAHELEPYDSAFVHLRPMSASDLSALTERLLGSSRNERARLKGLQPKRAGVIHGGALILDEIMRAGWWDEFVTSESNSLFGVVSCMHAQVAGLRPPLPWNPQMLHEYALQTEMPPSLC